MLRHTLNIHADKYSLILKFFEEESLLFEKLIHYVDLFDLLANIDPYVKDFLSLDLELYLNYYFSDLNKKRSNSDAHISPLLYSFLIPHTEFSLGEDFKIFEVKFENESKVSDTTILFSLLHNSNLEGLFIIQDMAVLRIHSMQLGKGNSLAKGVIEFGNHKKDIFILGSHLNIDQLAKDYSLKVPELNLDTKMPAGNLVFDTLMNCSGIEKLQQLISLYRRLGITTNTKVGDTSHSKIKSYNTRNLHLFDFKRSAVGEYSILVDIGDKVTKNTVLGVIQDFDILETIDLSQGNMAKISDLTKYMKVMQGELVVVGATLATIPNGKFSKLNITNTFGGIVDLSDIREGIVKIISLKEDSELLAEVTGTVTRIDKSDVFIETNDCRYIKLMFRSNDEIYDGEIICYRQNLPLDILRNKILWIESDLILSQFDFDLFRLAKIKYLFFNQINIDNILSLRNQTIPFGSVNGFGRINLIQFKDNILNSKVVNIIKDRLIIKEFN